MKIADRYASFQTIIVGSGAAGLNAAIMLYNKGIRDIAIITEGLKCGTSRNTGSDKQTYYKLTTSGSEPDSVRRMAEALFAGGCMDGDIALAEAAVSTRAFFHLVDLGVPFPCTPNGEYVGYKTDHDPCKRGISCGPLTSKYMAEKLIEEIERLQITVIENQRVLEILTEGEGDGKRAVGVLAMSTKLPREFTVYAAENVIYATGGEAAMYKTSVYPTAQIGGTGAALRAGVRGKNLTESQYGLASIKFRWNLSGSYQQVIPCYISTDKDGGDEREFLCDYFDTPEKELQAIFLKGYQWPFDPRKLSDFGSSLVDMLVYQEIVMKNRRVFLDFRRNPASSLKDGKFDFSRLSEEAYEYLKNSDSLQELPIERLSHMNNAAIELYKNHGIDLHTEMLEIAVCAQHNNGGLAGDRWWQSNIAHLFPVGEVNGGHGVYRPGGSALNAGQVGSIRASEYIARHYTSAAPDMGRVTAAAGDVIERAIAFGRSALSREGDFDIRAELETLRQRMSRCGACIRNGDEIKTAISEAAEQLERIETCGKADEATLGELYVLRDLAVSQIAYLSAIENYISVGGKSRGSYLIYDPNGTKPLDSLPEQFTFSLDNDRFSSVIQEVEYIDGKCNFFWRDRRPIPEETEWFETVWHKFLKGEGFN